ncbi:unnamed protein product, partial [Iphiclides podalirius]
MAHCWRLFMTTLMAFVVQWAIYEFLSVGTIARCQGAQRCVDPASFVRVSASMLLMAQRREAGPRAPYPLLAECAHGQILKANGRGLKRLSFISPGATHGERAARPALDTASR